MSTENSTPNYKTQIIEVERDQLVYADWNYKKPGTPEQMKKLANSILRDGSPGVLAIREIPGSLTDDGRQKFELIDGNHRGEAIFDTLGWQSARCENFGVITKAEAVLISRRRNALWFEEDLPAVSLLYKDVVLPEGFSAEELSEFMPESAFQIAEIAKLSEFDWNTMPDGTPQGDTSAASHDRDAKNEPDYVPGDALSLTIKMTSDRLAVWQEFAALADELGYGTKEDALDLALQLSIDAIQKSAAEQASDGNTGQA